MATTRSLRTTLGDVKQSRSFLLQYRESIPDPAWFVDSLNRYLYARNNPLLYFDPDGQVVFVLAFPALITWGSTVVFPTLATLAPLALPALQCAVGAAAAYAGYRLCEKLNNDRYRAAALAHENAQKKHNEQEEERKKPPYDGQALGKDPRKSRGLVLGA